MLAYELTLQDLTFSLIFALFSFLVQASAFSVILLSHLFLGENHMFQVGDFLFDLEVFVNKVQNEILMKGKVWKWCHYVKPAFVNMLLSLFIDLGLCLGEVELRNTGNHLLLLQCFSFNRK